MISKFKFLLSFFDSKQDASLIIFHLILRKLGLYKGGFDYKMKINYGLLNKQELNFNLSHINTIFEIFNDKTYGNIQLNRGDYVLDIGAHIGLFALYIQSTNEGIKIICIEPSFENQKYLEKNFNGIIVKKAISNKDGFIFFDTTGQGINHKVFTRGQSVECIKLNSLINEFSLNEIALMKMDIEGHEITALEDINCIKPKIKKVLIECHQNEKEIKQLLENARMNFHIV